MNRIRHALISRLARDRSGNAAVEFALIAPILVALLIGVIDLGKIAYDRSDMLAATRAGAQYLMAGGSDMTRAESVIRNAWTEMPQDGAVSVSRICECAGTASACDQPCPDMSVPFAYVSVEVSGTLEGVFLHRSSAYSDKIRIR